MHTPGPWEMDNSFDHAAVIHTEGIVIADVFKPQEGMLGTRRTASPCEYEQCEANARLIAAAPDLLEALKGLHEYCREQSAAYRNALDEQAEQMYAQVHKAIAKAEGKDH